MFGNLADVKPNTAFCNHTQTFEEAMGRLQVQKDRLQQKKKKVLISIGATDLKNGRPFFEMKREFTKLFMFCQQSGLKPLITTILCFDTPEIKAKADMFNDFLLESFENVVDMRQVIRHGLVEVMTSLNNK